MAGIVFESIAVCRRSTYRLRYLRVTQRPFVLWPSLVTQQHPGQRYSSSDGSADQTGQDQLHQMKPIQLGQGLVPKGKGPDGSEVTAAPPQDPKDAPGEKQSELPYEVRPEIPLEAPNRLNPTPLEVKPPNPHTIICTSDSEALGDKAPKDVDSTIGSEVQSNSSSSNELPPPVINLMDDQTPSPTATELDYTESPFIYIESDLDYQSPPVTTTVEDTGHQTEPTEKKAQSAYLIKSDEDALPPLPSQYDNKPLPKEPGSIATLDLKVKPQSSPSADNSERISQPKSEAIGSEWSHGSSFDLPGEGKIAEQRAEVEPIISSSAKDEYDGHFVQTLDNQDQETKGTSPAETVSENVNDHEIIDQWVDKFMRYYNAENAAFGLNNENQVRASSDKQKSEAIDEKARNRLQKMVMKDNKWVFDNKDSAKTESPSSEPSSSTTKKSDLPLKNKIEASSDMLNSESQDEKARNRLQAMVMKDNKWVFDNKDNKDTAEKVAPRSDVSSSPTLRSTHEDDFPLDIETTQHDKAFSNKKDETPVLTMVMKNNEWMIENKHTAETPSDPVLSRNDKTSPKGISPENIEANYKSHKDEKSSMSMVKKNNVWVLRDKDTAESISPSPNSTLTDKSNPEGTLPPKVMATEFRESKKASPALGSDKQAHIDASTIPVQLILGQTPAADKSESKVTEKSPGQATEEIVALFEKDGSKKGDQKHLKFLDRTTIPESTKDTFADVLEIPATVTHKAEDADEEKLDKAQEKKDAGDYFSKLFDLEESLIANSADDKNSNIVSMENSKMDDFSAEIDSSFEKAAKDSDSDFSEIVEEVDFNSILKEVEQKNESETETTSLLPHDLYDPVSDEVIAPEVEDREHWNTDSEASEVEANTEETPMRREKPELEEGELSMKLVDLDSTEKPSEETEVPSAAPEMPPAATEMPSAATEIPPAATEISTSEAQIPPSVERIPALGSESSAPRQKSLIQKLFEKILGGRNKNEGKREMSTYAVQRQLSTFALPQSHSPNGVKDLRQGNPVRALAGGSLEISKIHSFIHKAPAEVILKEADMKTPVLFAKETKDLTEIKGGTTSCASPKKSPRDLLREKQDSKKIKIFGGSEECAKKMKRIKELEKETDDDCGSDHFSILQPLS
ncbi:uncharacterized protein [Drosophila kikkawai]|uniref:Uncharacterized protein n=1 Tax=Drosophila kikkawai TaxID=30033 RepID=A0A6P4J8J8_DROKI|nr:uncharacterized protein LOC108081220 [Drosophila kikkawai]